VTKRFPAKFFFFAASAFFNVGGPLDFVRQPDSG
jgi:hypothetical protein